jgi:hypothetical protein
MPFQVPKPPGSPVAVQQFRRNSLLVEVQAIYPFMNMVSRPLFELGKTSKSNSNSERIQIEAQSIYNSQDLESDRTLSCYWEALRKFTESVSWAALGSTTLANAYSHRSSVLFSLKMYEQCLLDINRAFAVHRERGYLPESVGALMQRKVRCLEKIGMENYEINAEETNPIKVVNAIEENEWAVMSSVSNLNHSLLGRTSVKVNLERREHWGRCTVANDDIKPGTGLIFLTFLQRIISALVYNDAR